MPQKYNRSICYFMENTSNYFGKVIYENVQKNWFHNKYIYICRLQTFWSFMKFYFVHVKVCFVLVLMLIFLCICIKHFQHKEMRKNNSKLNFTKNCRASWFSHGRIKISKCFISLGRLDECSKSKVTTGCKQKLPPLVL